MKDFIEEAEITAQEIANQFLTLCKNSLFSINDEYDWMEWKETYSNQFVFYAEAQSFKIFKKVLEIKSKST